MRVVLSGSFFRMLSSNCSVTVSILAVASSRISSSGLRNTARIKAINCFCPKLIPSPEDLISAVSPPSNLSSKPFKPDSIKTFDSASFETLIYFALPYRILSRMVPLNRKGSCSINPILEVRVSISIDRISLPSSNICPPVGSYKRAMSEAVVVLPPPVGPTKA